MSKEKDTKQLFPQQIENLSVRQPINIDNKLVYISKESRNFIQIKRVSN